MSVVVRYMIKKYLQLTRFHSVPLETVPAIIGASLAVGKVVHINVLLWGIYGILYHVTGYGMNSYMDWKSGHDMTDPNKQHFPLNTGELSPINAYIAVTILTVVTFMYGLFLLIGKWIALIIIITGAIAGYGYNKIGKEIVWKSFLISYAHSTVFAVPYIASGGSLSDPILYLGWGYVFLWVLYQIQIEGDVKDMNTDEENFLINHGARYLDDMPGYDDYVGFPFWLSLYGHLLKLITGIIGVLITIELGGSTARQGIILFIIIVTSLVFGSQLLASGEYNRQNRIKDMSTIELLTMWALLIAVAPVIGLFWISILFFGSIIWVMIFNKIEWGTLLGPSV